MSLWKYKYFLDVVELKSFTKAGARNYVTQTAVSQQIASLEKMAGGTLLERGNGEICLTELGRLSMSMPGRWCRRTNGCCMR